jgi:hypothetical protein
MPARSMRWSLEDCCGVVTALFGGGVDYEIIDE